MDANAFGNFMNFGEDPEEKVKNLARVVENVTSIVLKSIEELSTQINDINSKLGNLTQVQSSLENEVKALKASGVAPAAAPSAAPPGAAPMAPSAPGAPAAPAAPRAPPPPPNKPVNPMSARSAINNELKALFSKMSHPE